MGWVGVELEYQKERGTRQWMLKLKYMIIANMKQIARK